MIIECTAYFKYSADSMADNNLQVFIINFKLSIRKKCILSIGRTSLLYLHIFQGNMEKSTQALFMAS